MTTERTDWMKFFSDPSYFYQHSMQGARQAFPSMFGDWSWWQQPWKPPWQQPWNPLWRPPRAAQPKTPTAQPPTAAQPPAQEFTTPDQTPPPPGIPDWLWDSYLADPMRDPSNIMRWMQMQQQQAAGTEGMTPYERAQIEMARNQMSLERQKTAAALAASPSSWIEAWYFDNPYPTRQSIGWGGKPLPWGENPDLPPGPGNPEAAGSKAYRKSDVGALSAILTGERTRWMAGPPMPEWMPQYLETPEGYVEPKGQRGIWGSVVSEEGVLGGGRFVPAAFPIKTPSLQQLTFMTPTQRAMLAGYGEAAGPGMGVPRKQTQSWSDIMAQVEAMRPAEIRGGKARRYQPGRQI